MKTYKIKLDEFDAHMMKAMKFNIQTIEDACLAGIAQQIRDQDEDEKKSWKNPLTKSKNRDTVYL